MKEYLVLRGTPGGGLVHVEAGGRHPKRGHKKNLEKGPQNLASESQVPLPNILNEEIWAEAWE